MSLKQKFQETIKKELKDELKIKNIMAVPALKKIVINIGLGEALTDSKVIDKVSEQLQAITGQKPQVMRAKVSISTFKLRAGDAVGLRVTMRGIRMYDFLEKFVSIVLPRVRDFRGISKKSFDGQGNYSLGIREQIVFPEIDYAKIDKTRGMEVTFVTSAKNNQEALLLLEKLGMPFEKE